MSGGHSGKQLILLILPLHHQFSFMLLVYKPNYDRRFSVSILTRQSMARSDVFSVKLDVFAFEKVYNLPFKRLLVFGV